MKTYTQLIKEINLANPAAALRFQPKKKEKAAAPPGDKTKSSGQGPEVKGTSGAEEAMRDVAGKRTKGRAEKSIFSKV